MPKKRKSMKGVPTTPTQAQEETKAEEDQPEQLNLSAILPVMNAAIDDSDDDDEERKELKG